MSGTWMTVFSVVQVVYNNNNNKKYMACKKKRDNWRSEDLQKTIEDVRHAKPSTRAPSAKYNVPRSTIHDTTLKVKEISRTGP